MVDIYMLMEGPLPDAHLRSLGPEMPEMKGFKAEKKS